MSGGVNLHLHVIINSDSKEAYHDYRQPLSFIILKIRIRIHQFVFAIQTK